MCRPVNILRRGLRQEQNSLKKARKVVKKYKKISLKKEMNRLRQLLPHGETLKKAEVLDQTILLIQQLEMKLLTRIQQSKEVPSSIAMMMDPTSAQSLQNMDLNMMRNIVMTTMMSNR